MEVSAVLVVVTGQYQIRAPVTHGVSVAFWLDGLFRTFVEDSVVVRAYVLVSRRLLPAMPVGECVVKWL